MTAPSSAPWRRERRTGSAADLLEPWPPPENQASVAVRAGRVSGAAAVVLGSTQDRALVDVDRATAAGLDVVRRSTGGGAVLVAPEAQVWLDLWVPRGHPLWDDDIVRAALWVGDAWMRGLESLGAGPLDIHRTAANGGAWSRVICFAGLGPGEVHAGTGPTPTKVMGLAQRRTGAGARFHTSAPLRWDPAPLLAVLAPDVVTGLTTDGGPTGVDSLPDAAVGLRRLVPRWGEEGADGDLLTTVEDAVISALP